MSDKVRQLDAESFDAVIKEDKVTLVDFWATWCGPCRMLTPIIEAVAGEVGDKVNICKVDVDKAPEIANRYNIMSVPTLIIFKNGEIKEKSVGLRQKEVILANLAKY